MTKITIKNKNTDYLAMLADTVGELVGKKSIVYRVIIKACTSENPLDLHLASGAFNGLPVDVRFKIAEKAKEIARQKVGVSEEGRSRV